MSFLERVIVSLSGEFKEKPVPYGWFHLLSLGILILVLVIVCVWGNRLNDKQFRFWMISISLSLMIFELYKQLQFSYDSFTETWEYGWYYFPFQFCSTPMYITFLVGVTKGKFQEYLSAFLATYALMGGIITMLYPATVFINTIGICIQTMYWHGMLIVIAILLWVNKKVKIEFKTVLKGLVVFIVVLLIAQIMNILFYKFGNHDIYDFNMFYISPYENSGLPVLGVMYEKLPFFIYFIGYIICFSTGSFLIVLVVKLIRQLTNKVKSKYPIKNTTKF